MVTAEQLVNRMNTNQRSVVQIKSGGSRSGAVAHQRRGFAQRMANIKRRHRGNQQVECQVCVCVCVCEDGSMQL